MTGVETGFAVIAVLLIIGAGNGLNAARLLHNKQKEGV